jgi:hypothetical protein
VSGNAVSTLTATAGLTRVQRSELEHHWLIDLAWLIRVPGILIF